MLYCVARTQGIGLNEATILFDGLCRIKKNGIWGNQLRYKYLITLYQRFIYPNILGPIPHWFTTCSMKNKRFKGKKMTGFVLHFVAMQVALALATKVTTELLLLSTELLLTHFQGLNDAPPLAVTWMHYGCLATSSHLQPFAVSHGHVPTIFGGAF